MMCQFCTPALRVALFSGLRAMARTMCCKRRRGLPTSGSARRIGRSIVSNSVARTLAVRFLPLLTTAGEQVSHDFLLRQLFVPGP